MSPLGKRAGRLVRRYRLHNGRPYKLPPRCASCNGYNLHAGTTVTERNRSGRERLSHYLLRPPLAKSRLTQRDDGDLVIHLSRAWADGMSAVVLTPIELIERLAAVIPAPDRRAP